ncbi:uncharacterized protein LOC130532879 [Takifugu flavidus]|uniref:uncharacterized protein LOC130532879 n=1 Tax=Takifugu flavidus TaxID=433684 RepID=UPI0025447A1C|nr:uncharacterized protein LOC130532879 [Takifugu flavidus]
MAMWTEETEDQLISLIQERPVLYDVSEKYYSNRAVKADLWREIEAKLRLSEKELRKRWDSLRTQYARYKKLAPLQKTGRQQWILTQLQFLDPHTKSKESTSSLNVMDHSQAVESDSASEEHNSETWSGFPHEDSVKSEQCPRQSPAGVGRRRAHADPRPGRGLAEFPQTFERPEAGDQARQGGAGRVRQRVGEADAQHREKPGDAGVAGGPGRCHLHLLPVFRAQNEDPAGARAATFPARGGKLSLQILGGPERAATKLHQPVR